MPHSHTETSTAEAFRRFAHDLKQADLVNGGALEVMATRLRARLALANEKELVSGTLGYAVRTLDKAGRLAGIEQPNFREDEHTSSLSRLRQSVQHRLDEMVRAKARHVLMARTDQGWRAIAVCAETSLVSRVDAVRQLTQYEEQHSVKNHNVLGRPAIRTAEGEWVAFSKTSVVDEGVAVEMMWARSEHDSARDVIEHLQQTVSAMQASPSYAEGDEPRFIRNRV